MSKYIFVTGGVVSGLGKGITAASLGRLLKSRGLKVAAQKLDPYINVDPGTMSPYQHGEVFVTEDGAETDLDLGHYERFIDENLNKFSNLTTGKVFSNVISKERRGEYLGKTVQYVPNITNEIKDFIYEVGKKTNADVVITEIGGTTGDIESRPFIEAIRQIGREQGLDNTLYIHVCLVPYLKASREHKSKPVQHSVKELRGMGISPNIIVLRADEKITDINIFKKVALFCDVKADCVIENTTLDNLYEAPLMLEKSHFSEIVIRELNLKANEPDLSDWVDLVKKIKNLKYNINIALVGKYIELHDAYLSVVEALKHAGYQNESHIDIKWIDSEEITESNIDEIFSDVDGIIVPGGFGNRGIEGMILTANYARLNHIPYFGICLGMQILCISYARNVLGLADANSFEFDELSKNRVIDYIPGQSDEIEKGGTLRLGAYPCVITDNTKMKELYKQDLISERHRHRYEFNNDYLEDFKKKGLTISGMSPDKRLVEAVELSDEKFYLGVQFHPEFKSRPNKAHPLFLGFIKASLNRRLKNGN
ncbi:MAG: CTP synthase [Acholeplasmatales bacterium]|nr:CTP synthase [Acholeplasmatales bacterium]